MASSAADIMSGNNAGNTPAAQDSQDISPLQVYQSLMNGLQPQAQQIIQQPAQQVPGMDQGGVQVQPQPMGTMRRILQGALVGLASGAGHLSPQADPSGVGSAFASGFQNSLAERQGAINQQNAALLAARQENRTQGAYEQKMSDAEQNNLMGKIGMAKALFESSYFPEALQQQMEKPITDWTAKVTDNGLMNIDQSFSDYESMQQAVFNAQKAGHPEYPGRLPNGQYVMLSPAKSGYSSQELADTLSALGIGDPSQIAQLRKQNLTYTSDTFGKILMAAGQKYSKDHSDVNAQLQAQHLKEEIANARLDRVKKTMEIESEQQVLAPGVFGDLPGLDPQQYNIVKRTFKKNADDLNKIDQSYDNFLAAAVDAANGRFTGAESVTSLFNAIGLSATPLKGAGFRINNSVTEEHLNSIGITGKLERELLHLKSGDVITPQQLIDYFNVAQQARTSAYINNINEARNAGLKPDFLLPQGNGHPLDKGTIAIFMAAANGNVELAKKAARLKGWR